MKSKPTSFSERWARKGADKVAVKITETEVALSAYRPEAYRPENLYVDPAGDTVDGKEMERQRKVLKDRLNRLNIAATLCLNQILPGCEAHMQP